MEKWQEEAVKKSLSKFNVVKGKNLPKQIYQEKRDCYSDLADYVTSTDLKYFGKICALYGLRRTGNTVMMYQCLANLDPEIQEQRVYIFCKEPCDMLELEYVMDDLYEQGFRYFFIDEITRVEDLQAYGNVLSDYFITIGTKVVIAGTDSLGIYLAKTDILYDRVVLLHTSQVPYAEFHRLCGGNLEEYIEYGGTLTNATYKDNQSAEEYLNTAIVKNILHGLISREEKRKHATVLTDLYDEEELVSVIQKMVNKFSYEITLRAINRSYKSGALYAIFQNSKKKYFDKLDIDVVNTATKKALEIKDSEEMKITLTEEDLESVKLYLKLLDLYISIVSFKSFKRGGGIELEILQQPGMIYSHATELLNQLERDDVWSQTCEIEDKTEFIQRADYFVKGILLENIILSETYKCYQTIDKKRFYVSQLSVGVQEGLSNSEADLIIVDREKKESYLFEIKHSDKVVDRQTRHLQNEDFINYVSENFAPVKKCCVIYNGQPTKIDSIDYLNAEKFLMTVHEMELSKNADLQNLFQQKEIEEIKKPDAKPVRKQEKKSSIHLTR